MNMKKRIINFLQVIMIVYVCFLGKSVSFGKVETKNINVNINKNIDLIAKAEKEDEFLLSDLNTPLDYFNGFLTGYAANCPACGGTLGCTGQNVLDGTTEFYDNDYGTVRIVASSSNLKCGSIVRFSLPSVSDKPITAIVLDRGVLGNNLDLLVESEEYAISHVGGTKLTYSVLRNGYTR